VRRATWAAVTQLPCACHEAVTRRSHTFGHLQEVRVNGLSSSLAADRAAPAPLRSAPPAAGIAVSWVRRLADMPSCCRKHFLGA